MLFTLALGPIAGANSVIMIRFAPVLDSIGGNTAPTALVMPAIAAIRGRMVSVMCCSARIVGTHDPVTVRTGRVVARIASVKCRFGLDMDASDRFMSATLSDMRETVSVIPRTMLVT